MPIDEKNEFLFETLAGGADAVVVCDPYAADRDGWWERIPDGVPKVASETDNPADWGVIELLQGLSEDGLRGSEKDDEENRKGAG